MLKFIFLMLISIFKIRQNIILKSLYIQIKDKHMMNYEEYNNFQLKDSNEKSKERKKITKFKPKRINSKFSELNKQIEEQEKQKRDINRKMNQYVAGPSVFD